MKVVFLGATRGMGRALARRMAQRGDDLYLLGRDITELEKSVEDLAADGKRPKGLAICDLREPERFEAVVQEASSALDGVDLFVISAGVFAPQAELDESPTRAREILDLDFTNTVLLCEAAKRLFLNAGAGHLAVFSSVAGERGRASLVLYGAAKAGLSRYLEALDHRHRRDGLKVTTIKPGFVRTGMTRGLKEPPFAADPEPVAEEILRGLDRGDAVIYAPKIWAMVMAVVRNLPRVVMRRSNF